MFCTNCGSKNAGGVAHCTSCGARVDGVGAAANMVSHAARNAFDSMDAQFRTSLMLGGGAFLLSLISFLLVGPAAILSVITIPATIALGIMSLNAGRDLANRTGYYLGTIGLVAGAVLLYIGVASLTMKSALSNMTGGLM